MVKYDFGEVGGWPMRVLSYPRPRGRRNRTGSPV